jgi:hypothetical protein
VREEEDEEEVRPVSFAAASFTSFSLILSFLPFPSLSCIFLPVLVSVSIALPEGGARRRRRRRRRMRRRRRRMRRTVDEGQMSSTVLVQESTR